MRGCGDTSPQTYSATPKSDDFAQASHEGDGGSLTAGVGFENGVSWFSGSWSRQTSTPYNGAAYAQVRFDRTMYSRLTRITEPSAGFRARAAYKAGGTTRLKFEYRPVTYVGLPPACSYWNPNTINWLNPVPGTMTLWENRALAPSPNSWSYTNAYVPTPFSLSTPGFTQYQSIDYRLQVYPETVGDALIDDLEATS